MVVENTEKESREQKLKTKVKEMEKIIENLTTVHTYAADNDL